MEKTLVVIGSCPKSDYSFLLPLTCLFWREVIGYETRVYLIGDQESWLASSGTAACLKALWRHGIRHRFISSIPGYADGTVGKHVRQHAAAELDIDEDTWVMPTDADLWPLRREYYYQHQGDPSLAVLYYSNGDQWRRKDATISGFEAGLRFPTISMMHATMRAREWRSVFSHQLGDVRGSIEATFKRCGVADDSHLPAGEVQAAWTWWVNSDQRVLTERLCRQEWFSEAPPPGGGVDGAVRFIERAGGPPHDRLDRAFPILWRSFDPKRWTDTHIHKNPERAPQWSTLLPVVRALLPQHVKWAEEYREEYLRAEPLPVTYLTAEQILEFSKPRSAPSGDKK